MIGNERLSRLPVWEMKFGSLPDSLPAIATRKVKWDRAYQKKYGITTSEASDLAPLLLARIDRLARRIYRALHLSGYARIDFRLRADGEPVRAGGQSESEPRTRGGFRCRRQGRGCRLCAPPRSHHAPGAGTTAPRGAPTTGETTCMADPERSVIEVAALLRLRAGWRLSACTSQSDLRKSELTDAVGWCCPACTAIREQVLLILNVFAPMMSGNVLYVRETDADDSRRVYSERIWSLDVSGSEHIVAMVYAFDQPDRWRDGAENPELFRSLLQQDLRPLPGCELIWEKTAHGYSATSASPRCPQSWQLEGEQLAFSDKSGGSRDRGCARRAISISCAERRAVWSRSAICRRSRAWAKSSGWPSRRCSCSRASASC